MHGETEFAGVCWFPELSAVLVHGAPWEEGCPVSQRSQEIQSQASITGGRVPKRPPLGHGTASWALLPLGFGAGSSQAGRAYWVDSEGAGVPRSLKAGTRVLQWELRWVPACVVLHPDPWAHRCVFEHLGLGAQRG